MLTALKPFLVVQLLRLYGDRPGLTEIKLRINTSPAFPLFLFAYSYRLFKKKKNPLKCSLGALCRFPGGGYTHGALETVWNQ